jgi:trk system potassium uptake protein TrkA
MAQQILIIGLGQFGMSLARTLSEKGAEVLAVDVKKSLVEEAAAFVTDALIVNATDETALARLEPKKRDSVVCAIGDESRESSIICTALLRQMGAPVIISRANDALHQRILQLVGAHQIINPEQEFGKRFANRLLYKHIISDADTTIGDSLQLTEIIVQPSMIGKTLIELALPKRFGVLVVGIRKNGKIHQPSPDTPLQEEDHLIIVSSEAAIPAFIDGV